MTTDQIIDQVLEREGGGTYTDRGDDAGGPTRWGITQATLGAWRGHPVEPGEVAALTEAEAREIYRREYVERPGFLQVPDDDLRALLVDMYVNHRPQTVWECVQRALGGLVVDGVPGPKTWAALLAADARRLWVRLACERLDFYGRRISKDHTDADRDGVTDAAEQAAGHIRRTTQMIREFDAKHAA